MTSIISFALSALAVLIVISVHEFAHAYMAYKLGDSTAKIQGRLTLNPLSHIDPFGFLALMIVGFGWAKPVPVYGRNFKNYRRDMALVSLAGPVSNILLAILIQVFINLLTLLPSSTFIVAVAIFLNIVTQLSVGLAVFNLLPIPPLDGSKVLLPYLPHNIQQVFYEKQQFIQFGMLALLMLGFLNPVLFILRSYMLNFVFWISDLLTFFI